MPLSRNTISFRLKRCHAMEQAGWQEQRPLHHAASEGQSAIVELLADSGADVHAESRVPCSGWRMSGVDWARTSGFHSTATLLERLGCAPASHPANVEDMVQMAGGQGKGWEQASQPRSCS